MTFSQPGNRVRAVGDAFDSLKRCVRLDGSVQVGEVVSSGVVCLCDSKRTLSPIRDVNMCFEHFWH